MDLELKGKKAFLAGSSRGLGFATASVLAEEGCQVIINGRNKDRLKSSAARLSEAAGVEVHALAGDVSDPGSSRSMIQEASQILGGLDLLVTNTGGPPSGKFTDHSDETWENAVNLVFLSHARLRNCSQDQHHQCCC